MSRTRDISASRWPPRSSEVSYAYDGLCRRLSFFPAVHTYIVRSTLSGSLTPLPFIVAGMSLALSFTLLSRPLPYCPLVCNERCGLGSGGTLVLLFARELDCQFTPASSFFETPPDRRLMVSMRRISWVGPNLLHSHRLQPLTIPSHHCLPRTPWRNRSGYGRAGFMHCWAAD